MLSTDRLKQYLLLLFIILLTAVLSWQLYIVLPGILASITLYILMREWFFKLTVIRNWKKWLTATIFILGSLLVFVLPFALLLQMIMPKITYFVSNPAIVTSGLETINAKISSSVPGLRLGSEQIRNFTQRAAGALPGLLGAAGNLLSNLVLCFFLLYFMLVDGRKMERKIQGFLPLKAESTDNIWQATRTMVISNAIGIPVLAICQAAAAGIGYYIFGIEEYLIWGTVTGVFSLVPVVGSAIVWAPLGTYLLATGHTPQGVGLIIYSIAVVTNIDNVLRFTLLKKLGDVHPIVTVLGIIVGLPLFGFMGFIFGPLLISYLLLLIKIYRAEFSGKPEEV